MELGGGPGSVRVKITTHGWYGLTLRAGHVGVRSNSNGLLNRPGSLPIAPIRSQCIGGGGRLLTRRARAAGGQITLIEHVSDAQRIRGERPGGARLQNLSRPSPNRLLPSESRGNSNAVSNSTPWPGYTQRRKGASSCCTPRTSARLTDTLHVPSWTPAPARRVRRPQASPVP